MQNSNNGLRKFPRVPKTVSITVNRIEYPVKNTGEETALTKNIAEQGVCFTVAIPYEVGAALSMKIDLKGWQLYLRTVLSLVDSNSDIKPLTAVGEVVWSKKLPDNQGYEIGVHFTDIYEDDYKAFKKYLHIIGESIR